MRRAGQVLVWKNVHNGSAELIEAWDKDQFARRDARAEEIEQFCGKPPAKQ